MVRRSRRGRYSLVMALATLNEGYLREETEARRSGRRRRRVRAEAAVPIIGGRAARVFRRVRPVVVRLVSK